MHTTKVCMFWTIGSKPPTLCVMNMARDLYPQDRQYIYHCSVTWANSLKKRILYRCSCLIEAALPDLFCDLRTRLLNQGSEARNIHTHTYMHHKLLQIRKYLLLEMIWGYFRSSFANCTLMFVMFGLHAVHALHMHCSPDPERVNWQMRADF